MVSWGFSYRSKCWKMSVWAQMGDAELRTAWVHWLWFKKMTRMKGPGGGARQEVMKPGSFWLLQ